MTTHTSVREANSYIRDLEKRLFQTQREEEKLTRLAEGLKFDNYNLKKSSYQNQAVATRLIVQRNTARFLNDKITNTIREYLKKANCKVNRESSIFEMLSLVGELIDEAWRKHETVLHENARLRESNNMLREENAVFCRRSKDRDKLMVSEEEDFPYHDELVKKTVEAEKRLRKVRETTTKNYNTTSDYYGSSRISSGH